MCLRILRELSIQISPTFIHGFRTKNLKQGVKQSIRGDSIVQQFLARKSFSTFQSSATFLDMITETLEKSLDYEEERGKPMPSRNHAAIEVSLIAEFIKHRDFRVYSELTLDFAGQPYTPDFSIYSREELDLRHDIIRRTDPPLLVVEIFSPRQGSQDIMEKVDVYFRNGVKSCWIIAPPLHTISILKPDGSTETHDSGVAKDPVTGITADLAGVFS